MKSRRTYSEIKGKKKDERLVRNDKDELDNTAEISKENSLFPFPQVSPLSKMEQTYSDDEKLLEEPKNTNEGELKSLHQTFDIDFDCIPKCFSLLENWIAKTYQNFENLKDKPLKDCIEKYNSDKIAFEEKNKLLTEMDIKLKKSKEKVDKIYKEALFQKKGVDQAIESYSEGSQAFAKSKSETEKNISNINLIIAKCNATTELLNKIKTFKESFKNSVSSASESIDKAVQSFDKITVKKNECISDINNFFKGKDGDIKSSCSKIGECNENIIQNLVPVKEYCNDISSNILAMNQINEKLNEDVGKVTKTNSSTFNKKCNEIEGIPLAQLDFSKTETAFDKINQNYNKVSEIFKCQAELQEIYEMERSSSELIETLQNRKSDIRVMIKDIKACIDSVNDALKNNETESIENQNLISKDTRSSIKNINNIFSNLKAERDSNLSLMNQTQEIAAKLNSSIEGIEDIQFDILKELQKDCGSELKSIIEKLHELKQTNNTNGDESLNSKAAQEIKDLCDNHYKELSLFIKTKVSHEIREFKSKYIFDKMVPKLPVNSKYPKISLAELITQFPKIYKTFESIYNHYKSADENDFADTPEIAKHIYKLIISCFGDYIEYTKYFEDLVQFKNNTKEFLKEIGNIQIANQDYEIKDEIKNLKKSIMNNSNQLLQDNRKECKKAIELKIEEFNQIFIQLNNHLAKIDKTFESEEQNKKYHLAQIAEKEKKYS